MTTMTTIAPPLQVKLLHPLSKSEYPQRSETSSIDNSHGSFNNSYYNRSSFDSIHSSISILLLLLFRNNHSFWREETWLEKSESKIEA
ncbi:uncharacterized protein TrAFT101_005934 [Trichoderma asperellum]|uniref:uncharacterized protein n=1 Tax=Trichoderma asperellum TaxID=101201 RepID=UPI00331A8874|nr:hypothetical protein TrAFT101_005934 [Trichoderma asperellum]